MLGPLSPTLTRLLLLVTFLESLGAVLLQRGLYFYTSAIHGFSASQNLWLAFVQGGSYVLGALGSHALAERAGERRAMLGCLAALFFLHATLAVAPTTSLITVAFPLIGMMQGLKWPLVESYASAGRDPQALLALLGKYNVSWALAIPLALTLVGALIGGSAHRHLFTVPAVINALAIGLVLFWPARPERFSHDHPERPAQATIDESAALLASSRWTMLSSYLLLFLLAPLMPVIFQRLELPVRLAPSAAALLDVLRIVTFALLGAWGGWHGRALLLALAGVALPVSFFMVLFGENLLVVLLGEALFGVASGLAYYSALYYALLVKNASVDAGGAHEGVIGLGFALGPLAGLLGHALTEPVGGYVPAMLLSTLPLVVLFFGAALRPLVVRPRRRPVSP